MEPIALQHMLDLLGTAVINVAGSTERTVAYPASIREAPDAAAITLCRKTGEVGRAMLLATRAGVVICPDDLSLLEAGKERNITLILVKDPRLAFLRVVQAFFTPPPPRGIHPTAIIDPGAKIDPEVYIGPYTSVGQCEIGTGTVIHGHVHLYNKTRIGRNVTIHAGTVIGTDGFGYQRNEDGEPEKFPHLGGVLIEDDVEIGANTCIDRGTLGDTIIRQAAKIDNLVHIAHNVVVGRGAFIIAHAQVAGSVVIGDGAWIAPGANVINGITVGARSTVGIGAVVLSNVPDQAKVLGNPARLLPEQFWDKG
jgi:UDP-3-O-[3-hydroxymyristoyl] glucosamine N-acyltransferase